MRTINTFKQINSRIRRQTPKKKKKNKTGTDDESWRGQWRRVMWPQKNRHKSGCLHTLNLLKPKWRASCRISLNSFTGSEEQNGGKKVNKKEREKKAWAKANYLQPLQKVFPVSYKALSIGFLQSSNHTSRYLLRWGWKLMSTCLTDVYCSFIHNWQNTGSNQGVIQQVKE